MECGAIERDGIWVRAAAMGVRKRTRPDAAVQAG